MGQNIPKTVAWPGTYPWGAKKGGARGKRDKGMARMRGKRGVEPFQTSRP